MYGVYKVLIRIISGAHDIMEHPVYYELNFTPVVSQKFKLL